jgi:molybdopterin converting factor subunit 1
MDIKVLCFASTQDITGTRELTLACAEPATVRDAAAALTAAYPALKPIVTRLRFAVNEEFAEDDTPVRSGDTLALLPPMSGG